MSQQKTKDKTLFTFTKRSCRKTPEEEEDQLESPKPLAVYNEKQCKLPKAAPGEQKTQESRLAVPGCIDTITEEGSGMTHLTVSSSGELKTTKRSKQQVTSRSRRVYRLHYSMDGLDAEQRSSLPKYSGNAGASLSQNDTLVPQSPGDKSKAIVLFLAPRGRITQSRV